jgi:hypothetical protein
MLCERRLSRLSAGTRGETEAHLRFGSLIDEVYKAQSRFDESAKGEGGNGKED